MRRPALTVALIGLGTVAVPLDSAVNIAFPDITQSFGLPIPAIQWVVIAYVLTHASLMLACGRIGDIAGHGTVFRAGLLVSGAAYLLCSLATDYGWLLAFRVLQGIGAALVISCGPALVTGLYPEAYRARLLGLYTMMFALGSALGPSLGGVLVELWGWPAVFWARAPLALTALLLIWELPAAPDHAGRERFDIAGAALLAAAMSAVLMTVAQIRPLLAGEALGLVPAAAAVVLIIAHVRRGRRSASRIVDFRALRSPAFLAANAGNTLVNLAAFSVYLLAPYYLVRFTGLPIAACGAILAAAGLGTVTASPVSGWLAGRLGPRRLTIAGAALVASGLFLTGGWRPETGLPLLAASLFIGGFGLGLFQVAYMDLVTATMPLRDRGVAGSLAMLTRTVGIVVGATVLSLLFETFAAGSGPNLPDDAFLAGFGGTFRLAALLAAGVCLLLILVRSGGRGDGD